MHKVGFYIGVFMMYTYTQAKSSPVCHPPSAILGKEEEICLSDLLLLNTSKEPDCKGMWDHLNCWPHATAGDIVSQPCPDFFNSEGIVSRNCTVKGWSDLLSPHEDACEFTFNEMFHSPPESPDHMYFYYVKAMYTVGYALSLISLTIAVAILCMFRKLHCTRNYIHIQLFVSFMLRAIFIFVRDSLLFTDEEFYHCDYYPVACKVALLFTNYSILANYSWLLAEGHFLYTLVSRSFFSLKKHLAWYIVLAWGTPLIVIISWGCAKYFYEDEGCWETRRHEWIWWILRVPVLPFIFMNLVFFIGILRILVGKLRQSDGPRNEFSQYKRLIKSTFFLVALFGLHYILFGFLPVKLNGLVFKIWNFAELALSSTQGFVVAVLYCFMNGEVQHEIQRRWRRWRLRQNLPHGHQRTPRQHHGSISQSGLTQVTTSLLLPCSTPPPPPLGGALPSCAASQRPLQDTVCRPHVTRLS